jgi:hypothetical protein
MGKYKHKKDKKKKEEIKVKETVKRKQIVKPKIEKPKSNIVSTGFKAQSNVNVRAREDRLLNARAVSLAVIKKLPANHPLYQTLAKTNVTTKRGEKVDLAGAVWHAAKHAIPGLETVEDVYQVAKHGIGWIKNFLLAPKENVKKMAVAAINNNISRPAEAKLDKLEGRLKTMEDSTKEEPIETTVYIQPIPAGTYTAGQVICSIPIELSLFGPAVESRAALYTNWKPRGKRGIRMRYSPVCAQTQAGSFIGFFCPDPDTEFVGTNQDNVRMATEMRGRVQFNCYGEETKDRHVEICAPYDPTVEYWVKPNDSDERITSPGRFILVAAATFTVSGSDAGSISMFLEATLYNQTTPLAITMMDWLTTGNNTLIGGSNYTTYAANENLLARAILGSTTGGALYAYGNGMGQVYFGVNSPTVGDIVYFPPGVYDIDIDLVTVASLATNLAINYTSGAVGQSTASALNPGRGGTYAVPTTTGLATPITLTSFGLVANIRIVIPYSCTGTGYPVYYNMDGHAQIDGTDSTKRNVAAFPTGNNFGGINIQINATMDVRWLAISIRSVFDAASLSAGSGIDKLSYELLHGRLIQVGDQFVKNTLENKIKYGLIELKDDAKNTMSIISKELPPDPDLEDLMDLIAYNNCSNEEIVKLLQDYKRNKLLSRKPSLDEEYLKIQFNHMSPANKLDLNNVNLVNREKVKMHPVRASSTK